MRLSKRKNNDISCPKNIRDLMNMYFGGITAYAKLFTHIINCEGRILEIDNEMYIYGGRHYEKIADIKYFIVDSLTTLGFSEINIEKGLIKEMEEELRLKGKMNYRRMIDGRL